MKSFSFNIFGGKSSLLTLLIPVLLVMSGCAGVPKSSSPWVQTGIASWYGPNFHGRPTSSREIYNMHDMTAAHKTLPFGTHVMVTNLNNQRSVIVRINDRGPFVKNRIIDLSYASARVLEIVGPGTAPVRIEVLPDLSPDPQSQRYSVQVGSFSDRNNALFLQKQLQKEFREVYISTYQTRSYHYHRVRIKAADPGRAEKIAQRLRQLGYVVLILEER